MPSNAINLDFTTIDVFTQTKFEGNPLAIVTIPRSVGITQEQKQAIAREFNLSETTFLHERKSEDLQWTVDIFLTNAEIPFAGHPIIGTAVYALSRVALEQGVKDGKIEAKLDIKAGQVELVYDVKSKSAKAAIPHNLHAHERSYAKEEVQKLQPALIDAKLADSYPIVSVVKGMTFILIELFSSEDLAKVTTTGRTIIVEGLDAGWDETFVGTYFFVRSENKADGTRAIQTRMIEGLIEDPATGSAATDLAGHLAVLEGHPGETMRFAITQGVQMGRRSDISVEVVLAEEGGIETVYLEGSAVKVMEGRLTV